MKTYDYTDEQRNYLDMVLRLHDEDKLRLTEPQMAAIVTIRKYQQYGPYEKGVLNSIKYAYEFYVQENIKL